MNKTRINLEYNRNLSEKTRRMFAVRRHYQDSPEQIEQAAEFYRQDAANKLRIRNQRF